MSSQKEKIAIGSVRIETKVEKQEYPFLSYVDQYSYVFFFVQKRMNKDEAMLYRYSNGFPKITQVGYCYMQ
ncbi:hypothetical protein TDB9533_04497 [Thalassocella blandensis]|nr:hypothetical protein TDB9533_04497 [Thalassocella blandensis]